MFSLNVFRFILTISLLEQRCVVTSGVRQVSTRRTTGNCDVFFCACDSSFCLLTIVNSLRAPGTMASPTGAGFVQYGNKCSFITDKRVNWFVLCVWGQKKWKTIVDLIVKHYWCIDSDYQSYTEYNFTFLTVPGHSVFNAVFNIWWIFLSKFQNIYSFHCLWCRRVSHWGKRMCLQSVGSNHVY